MGFSRLGINTALNARIAETKIREAMQELRRRHVRVDENCSRCNFDSWNIDLLEIPATSLMATAPSLPPPPNYVLTGATNLPVLSIVCQRCGYTIFHNLQVLGISMR